MKKEDAIVMGGLALLVLANKKPTVTKQQPSIPTVTVPQPTVSQPPPPPPQPPIAQQPTTTAPQPPVQPSVVLPPLQSVNLAQSVMPQVTISSNKTEIYENETATLTMVVSGPPPGMTGAQYRFKEAGTNEIVDSCFGFIQLSALKYPLTISEVVREMVYYEPITNNYMISLSIGTHRIAACFGDPIQVCSSPITITRKANGYLRNASLVSASRMSDGSIKVVVDIDADAGTYNLVQLWYDYPGYPGIAKSFLAKSGGTFTFYGPKPYETYMKLSQVHLVVNHPGDKQLTTNSLPV